MTIDIQPFSDHIWRVMPHGRLDVAAARALEEALADMLDAGQVWVVVDFASTAYITSAGLKALLTSMRRARKMGGNITLAAMNERVREIFDMAGFDQVFQISATVEEAAQALAG